MNSHATLLTIVDNNNDSNYTHRTVTRTPTNTKTFYNNRSYRTNLDDTSNCCVNTIAMETDDCVLTGTTTASLSCSSSTYNNSPATASSGSMTPLMDAADESEYKNSGGTTIQQQPYQYNDHYQNSSLPTTDEHDIEDIFATVHAMHQQEVSRYVKCDPLRQKLSSHFDHDEQDHAQQLQLPSTQPIDIDEICRTKMCQWSYQIVDYCQFHRESVDIAMNYLDRFLLTPIGQAALYDRNIYQLVSMTCLYSAIKIHERQALSPSVVSQLSRNIYSPQQIMQMEVTILHALEWQLHPPTIHSYVREILSALCNMYNITLNDTVREAIRDIAQKQTEYAVCDYRFIEIPSSLIAYCCIMNALECVSLDTKNNWTLSTDTIHHISSTIRTVLGYNDNCNKYNATNSLIMTTQELLSNVCPKPQIQHQDQYHNDTESYSMNELEYSTSSRCDHVVADDDASADRKSPSSFDDAHATNTTKTIFDTSPRSTATTDNNTNSGTDFHHHEHQHTIV